MISPAQAQKIINKSLRVFPVTKLPLQKALGALLRENIYADRDSPPFNKALMDGVAVNVSSYKQGNRILKVAGVQPAGKKPLKLKNKNHCIEIMTGAPLPLGTNGIIPVEQVQIKNGFAFLKNNLSLTSMSYVRKKGEEHKKGKLLVKSGCALLPPQIAVAASVGKTTLKVSARPLVAVISTGDELVALDKKPKVFQIRLSNSYALEAAFQETSTLKTEIFHIRDNLKILRTQMRKILRGFDVIVLSGGVSEGKFDYVPRVLKELGAKVLFHKVAQRPGKPFWFGKTKNGKPIFALPGNPVSTLVCCYRYVLPALRKALGIEDDFQKWGILSKKVPSYAKSTRFLPVKVLYHKQGQIFVTPVGIAGSGDLAALAPSDGFIEIPRGEEMEKGTSVKLFLW